MAMTGGTAKLVGTGYPDYGKQTNYPVKLYVYYKSSQNKDTNKSTVYVGMYVVVSAGYPVGPWTDYGGSYVGTEDLTFNGSIPNMTGTRWLVENKSFVVEHNDEGEATATIKWKWGVRSNWGQFYEESGSFSVKLPTIPRASTIGATDANIESVSTVTINKMASAYTHSIFVEFGSLSGYLTSAGKLSTSETKFSATSIAFTIPTTFYDQIPNAKSGKCKLTCRTYSGTTQVGTDKTCTFNVVAKESLCRPQVSGQVLDANAVTKALTGDNTVLIRYHSTAHCVISATAKNGATISQKKIGGVEREDGIRDIQEIETDTIAFYAKDSRGYYQSVDVSYKLIPYIRLTNNATANRTDPTSGNAILTLKGNFYNGSFGAVSNELTAKYRVNEGDWVSVTPELDGDSYSVSILITDLDYKTSHVIEVLVEDALDSVSKKIPIDPGIPLFDWGQDDFRINVALRLVETCYGPSLPSTGKKGQLFFLENADGTYTLRIHDGTSW